MAKKLQFVGNNILSEDEAKKIVDEYLAENPPVAQTITINGKGPDENGNFVINTSTDTEDNMVEF